MKVINSGKKLFFILFSVWIIFGILSVIYNVYKGFWEIKEWGFLPVELKREKIYGEYYSFYKFLKNNSDSKEIFLYTRDPRAFFIPRYFLYPQKITWIHEKEEFLNKLNLQNNNNYAIYDSQLINDENYEITFFNLRSQNKGVIIKR